MFKSLSLLISFTWLLLPRVAINVIPLNGDIASPANSAHLSLLSRSFGAAVGLKQSFNQVAPILIKTFHPIRPGCCGDARLMEAATCKVNSPGEAGRSWRRQIVMATPQLRDHLVMHRRARVMKGNLLHTKARPRHCFNVG